MWKGVDLSFLLPLAVLDTSPAYSPPPYQTVDALTNEGLLYSTTDDHYKAIVN